MSPKDRSHLPADSRRTLPQRACLALLRLFGWQVVVAPLPGPKGVIIVYPHTSNWDFVLGLLYRFGVGLRANWMGKDTMFRWPLRRLLFAMGGVPINRREPRGVIAGLIEACRQSDWMWLALAPEGTRARTGYLKSGFYQVAVGANVPCGLAFIDYATRTIGIAEYLMFSGDPEADLARLREFYADKCGRFPERAGEIQFRRGGPAGPG